MPWYVDFFDDDYIRFDLHGGAMHAERAPRECDFIVEALKLERGDRILDLCCGQGRHAVELAKRGFEVTGVDLSEYLLGLAERAAQKAGVTVVLCHCDMREITWETEFDAVISMFTSFGYFESDEENERALRAARQALQPEGRLLLDLPNREAFGKMVREGQRDWAEHEEHLVLDEWGWNDDGQRLRLDRTIIDRDWSRRQKGFDMRQFTHPEIVDMMKRVDLNWQRTFCDLDLSDFEPESRRMLVVARRGL